MHHNNYSSLLQLLADTLPHQSRTYAINWNCSGDPPTSQWGAHFQKVSETTMLNGKKRFLAENIPIPHTVNTMHYPPMLASARDGGGRGCTVPLFPFSGTWKTPLARGLYQLGRLLQGVSWPPATQPTGRNSDPSITTENKNSLN